MKIKTITDDPARGLELCRRLKARSDAEKRRKLQLDLRRPFLTRARKFFRICFGV